MPLLNAITTGNARPNTMQRTQYVSTAFGVPGVKQTCASHGPSDGSLRQARGAAFGDVAQTDPSYCAWVLRERADGTRISRYLKPFANYIQDARGGVLVVGRHSGRLCSDVLWDPPEYGEGAASLENPDKLKIGFPST